MGGRSRGCRTCKRRRVKCDETHPTCLRCERASIVCNGYDEPVLFVDERPRLESRALVRRSNIAAVVPGASSQHSISLDFSSKPYQDDLYVSFMVRELFKASRKNDDVKSWAAAGTNSSDPANVTTLSVRCLAATFFGRMRKDQRITKYGSMMYGKALTALNQDIRDPEKAFDHQVLTSTMVLEIYELIALTSNDGWLQHAGGIGRLIEIRGPWRHQRQSERKVLEYNRRKIIVQALATQKGTFLEQDIWKKVPWALEPESKCLLQHLLDIMSDLPGICVDWLSLGTPGKLSELENKTVRNRLSHKVADRLQQLYDWRWKWYEKHEHCAFEVIPKYRNLNLDENGDNLFSTVLYFQNLELANEISLYNTALSLLLQLRLTKISPTSQATGCVLPPRKTPLLLPGQIQSPRDPAIEICRSVEYHLLEHHATAGAHFLLFPLRIAHWNLSADPILSRWLSKTCQRMADWSGFEVGRTLVD